METITKQWTGSSKKTVSFEISDDDWCLLQMSEPWDRIQRFLDESESRGNQMSLKERVDLLEGPLTRQEQ